MNWYIADTHFFHKNIIRYCDRPFNDVEEMNNAMIENWNKKVKKSDSVYILGDFAFCNGPTANELLDKLNGKKFLIKGNHDLFLEYKSFDQSKFEWVKDYAEISDHNTLVILCHYPIASWKKKRRHSIHLHGHMHNKGHRGEFNIDGYIMNVGADLTDFAPISFKKILNHLNWQPCLTDEKD